MTSNSTIHVPKNFDHLIYTSHDLEVGRDNIEKLLGVRPVIGGRHPVFGTHNALLSLGESIYLEVMAPCPDLPAPANGRLFERSYQDKPKLTTWVLRSEEINTLTKHATDRGLGLGPVQPGSRIRPDGTIISWELSDPFAFPMQGAIPFLISWGNTPHPSKSLPSGGHLRSVSLSHPEPNTVEAGLHLIDVKIPVNFRDSVRIEAHIETDKGMVILT